MDRPHRLGQPVDVSVRSIIPMAAIALAIAPWLGAGVPAVAEPGVMRLAQAQPGGVRRIAPDLVAPPQVDDGELERDDPRAPLSEIGPAARPAPPVAAPGPRRQSDGSMMRPVASAAGRLEAGGVVIAIAGIEIIEPEHTCRRPDGSVWPCGAHARTAFRSFLRARAVDCGDLPEGTAQTRFSVACTVGGQDIGAWLVANGWAKVTLDGPYGEEQRVAIEQRRGIFGPGPAAPPGTTAEPPAAALSPGTSPGEPATAEPEPEAANPRPRVTIPPGGAGLY